MKGRYHPHFVPLRFKVDYCTMPDKVGQTLRDMEASRLRCFLRRGRLVRLAKKRRRALPCRSPAYSPTASTVHRQIAQYFHEEMSRFIRIHRMNVAVLIREATLVKSSFYEDNVLIKPLLSSNFHCHQSCSRLN